MTDLYRHFNKEGDLLYVGISISALNRFAQHKIYAHWVDDVSKIEIEKFKTRQEALNAERAAIYNEKPKHNIKHNKSPEYRGDLDVGTSRKSMTLRLIAFKPAYNRMEISEMLGVSIGMVKNLWESNHLGFIRIDDHSSKILSTGWQVLDYLEARINAEKNK